MKISRHVELLVMDERIVVIKDKDSMVTLTFKELMPIMKELNAKVAQWYREDHS